MVVLSGSRRISWVLQSGLGPAPKHTLHSAAADAASLLMVTRVSGSGVTSMVLPSGEASVQRKRERERERERARKKERKKERR